MLLEGVSECEEVISSLLVHLLCRVAALLQHARSIPHGEASDRSGAELTAYIF